MATYTAVPLAATQVTGTDSWTNPSNILLSDGSMADGSTLPVVDAPGRILLDGMDVALAANIPADAVINSVKVKNFIASIDSSGAYVRIYLTIDGGSTEHGSYAEKSGIYYPTAPYPDSGPFGIPHDAITRAQLIASDFGVIVEGVEGNHPVQTNECRVDYLTLEIDYTQPAGSTDPPNRGDDPAWTYSDFWPRKAKPRSYIDGHEGQVCASCGFWAPRRMIRWLNGKPYCQNHVPKKPRTRPNPERKWYPRD